MATAHEYQSRITHRIQVVVTITSIVEVPGDYSLISAQAQAIAELANKFTVSPISYRYGASIDHAEMGGATFKSLPLKPVPDEEAPTEE